MRDLLLALAATSLLAVGCFSPSFPEGRPCGPDNQCPGSLECDLTTQQCLSDVVIAFDASPNAADAAVTDGTVTDAAVTDALGTDAFAGECNPVEQTGCASGLKCTQVLESESPLVTRVDCVFDGSGSEGSMCSVGAAGDTGFDDCAAGLFCYSGMCTPICGSAPNTCNSGYTCTQFPGLFDSLENVGVCTVVCDPVAQDCPGSDACYLNVTMGGTTSCAPVAPGAEMHMQDDPCFGPGSGGCFLNGCAEGFGPVLVEESMMGMLCAGFCSPVLQHSGDTSALGGDPMGTTCADRGVPMHECRFVQSFYGDTGAVDASIGFCVPTAVWDTCANSMLGMPTVPGCEPLP